MWTNRYSAWWGERCQGNLASCSAWRCRLIHVGHPPTRRYPLHPTPSHPNPGVREFGFLFCCCCCFVLLKVNNKKCPGCPIHASGEAEEKCSPQTRCPSSAHVLGPSPPWVHRSLRKWSLIMAEHVHSTSWNVVLYRNSLDNVFFFRKKMFSPDTVL